MWFKDYYNHNARVISLIIFDKFNLQIANKKLEKCHMNIVSSCVYTNTLICLNN